jgi:hypothetical protein
MAIGYWLLAIGYWQFIELKLAVIDEELPRQVEQPAANS